MNMGWRRGRRPAAWPVRSLVGVLLTWGCGEGGAVAEAWVSRPVAEWPDLVLTNDVAFADTTYEGLGNAFLVEAADDTVGVTVKHLFLVFGEEQGLETVSLGPRFAGWRLRSPQSGTVVELGRLLNDDPSEPVGDFNTLKVRDWLVFDVVTRVEGVVPLKVRTTPLRRGEGVYAVGRSRAARGDAEPTVVPMRVVDNPGPYVHVRPMDPDADPVGTSGSPVIDENGHLVGIVSGATGMLGVVGGVGYLLQVLGGAEARPLETASGRAGVAPPEHRSHHGP